MSHLTTDPIKIGSTNQLTGEDYITGDDGVPRMSINVWGHVKYPGTYLVYDGIDVSHAYQWLESCEIAS